MASRGPLAQIDILKVSEWDAWVRAVDVGGQVISVGKGRGVAAAVGGCIGVWRAPSGVETAAVRVGIRVLGSAKRLVALLGDASRGDGEADLWKDW